MTPADARLMHLCFKASMRSAGALPWLLLSGWIVLAAAQEPLFLRGYGLQLLDQASWAGAAVVLAALSSGALGRCRRPVPRIAATLGLLATLALFATLAACVAELAANGVWNVTRRLAVMGDFLAIWAATAITLAAGSTGRGAVGMLFLLAQVGCAVALSAQRFDAGWSPVLVGATVSAVAAALFATDLPLKRKQ